MKLPPLRFGALKSTRVHRLFRPGVEVLEVRNLLSTYTVDHLADDLVGSGLNGSLRYCITNATDGDTITFGVTGTISLTGALPGLTHSIRMLGPGADQLTVRRDTGGDYRIFTVGSGATVGISGLTIATGNHPDGSGGGIWNIGMLTVSDSTISSNTARHGGGGGLVNNGTLTVNNSTIGGNGASFGGGLVNNGAAMVSDSNISGNSAGNGGGIYNLLPRILLGKRLQIGHERSQIGAAAADLPWGDSRQCTWTAASQPELD
jgi:hypothetical protein